MSKTLKPCPFCGGEAEVRYSELSWKFVVRCTDCGAMGRQWFAGKFGEECAIDSWNNRAGNNRARHTCRNTSDWVFECSVCGAETVADSCGEFSPDVRVIVDGEECEVKFCPNCGARVVSEEEQGHMVADAIRRLEKVVE